MAQTAWELCHDVSDTRFYSSTSITSCIRSWIALKGSSLIFGDNQVVIHLDTSSFAKEDGRLSTQVRAFL